ncbi:hypothetical protein CCMSSC00406_0009849 [Pleurotus cornucopiae]|uniref:Uncharacterized protein n=1 Tax=Pleurotus cornucopiae TaxID=5321 RepID=A0ACB7J3Y7_PLECO|nr:hypothetical protein CCMSSC00406_0009849 [Pleurotus cornucopiae]
MPPEPEYLRKGLEIEYLEDRNMRHEMLATERDADKVAPRAVYDEHDVAHIAVTNPFSVGTATVWYKVERERLYYPRANVDVRFCVEFASQEDCTRFIREDMKLEDRHISDRHTDVAVIDDIMDALSSISGNYFSAKNAVRRGIPYSQFKDEYPEPETQLIRHRGHHRPCYLTLSISASLSFIERVDWSATTIPPTVPSPCGSFQSLNNLHLKFPSHSSQQDDLTITISAREISFLDGANSVSAGNSFSINSVHRTVTVNYINNIGDAFLAPIHGGNIGGRNNTNTSSYSTTHIHAFPMFLPSNQNCSSYESPKQLTAANGALPSSSSATGSGSGSPTGSVPIPTSGSKAINT